jgi:hypothetical protein
MPLIAFQMLLTFFMTGLNFDSPDSATLKINKTSDFDLTGSGTSKQWASAPWTPLPHRSGAKKYETKIKLLYSATGIYGLFYCEDDVITSTLKADNADLYNEDVVEIFFWPDESKPLYFEYELSPHNYELTILVPNDKGKFLGWLPWHYEGDRKTRHATQIAEKYWTAEFFIPYALLAPLGNVPPTQGMKWRCNFYRIDYDAGTSDWSWQKTRTNFHDYEKFGTLLFN